MERLELLQGLTVISNQYKYDGQSFDETADIWYEIFKTFTFNQFKQAIITFISNDIYGKFPKPGNIMQYINIANKKKQKDFTEVWAEIRNAIGKSTYYSNQVFENLSDEAKEIVRSASNLRSWAMDEDFNEGVMFSNLKRTYDESIRRKREIEAIPENLRKGIGFDTDYTVLEKKECHAISDNFQNIPKNTTTDFSEIKTMLDNLKTKFNK